jgi:hypothetical protein
LILGAKLSAVPKVNLIQNIGFGGSATHTRIRPPGLNNSLGRFTFPINHPKKIHLDRLQNAREFAVKSVRAIVTILMKPSPVLDYITRSGFNSK